VINKKNNHLANNNKDDEDLHLVALGYPPISANINLNKILIIDKNSMKTVRMF